MSMDRCPGQDTRLWKPGDIFDLECPGCGARIEFFKDESRRVCKKCGYEIPNPKLNLGCAQWCEHAEQCLGARAHAEKDPGAADAALGQRMKIRLISEMKAVFGDDARRVAHALKVLQHAERILECEKANPVTVIAAAILHDIGIIEAERKHGSSAPKYQELEGPPIARAILKKLDISGDVAEHIVRIVGSHHTAGDIESPEFNILWDADMIVNIPDERAGMDKERLKAFIEKTFRTETGKKIALDLYCVEYTHEEKRD
ncbi:MAG TPA: HD domain-containing protein [bacterium]|nr:HD domain-containing protein [bacterium]